MQALGVLLFAVACVLVPAAGWGGGGPPTPIALVPQQPGLAHELLTWPAAQAELAGGDPRVHEDGKRCWQHHPSGGSVHGATAVHGCAATPQGEAGHTYTSAAVKCNWDNLYLATSVHGCRSSRHWVKQRAVWCDRTAASFIFLLLAVLWVVAGTQSCCKYSVKKTSRDAGCAGPDQFICCCDKLLPLACAFAYVLLLPCRRCWTCVLHQAPRPSSCWR